jgi:hypothetical protein
MPPQPRCAKTVPAGPCAKECCNAKSTPENKYCKKHQLQIFIDETESLGKRNCKNVIRGCTAQLDQEYEFVRCEPCRKREKERDDARKARSLENAAKVQDENPESRFCKNCEKTKPLDEFVGTKNKGYVKSCKDCRETWIRNDKNRDKEHRNALERETSKKPERIAVKKAWEAANPDKVEQKIKKSRAKRAAKDIDGYLQHNANVMKNWRDKNPEKMEEANRKRRESIEAHFKIYQRSARLKKLQFTFSEEEFKALVTQNCYYCDDFGTRNESRNLSILPKNDEGVLKEECNIIDEKGLDENPDCVFASPTQVGFRINVEEPKSVPSDSEAKGKVLTAFNGIDRMNQAEGYIQSNCVSCCAMCNWMKGSLDSATFIKRIQHIYSFTKNIDPHQKYPECFPDAKCVSYSSYRSRAEKKELEFAITNADYKSIILQDCYLCGKKSTDTNTNGIDRVDNTIGYTIANCKACCKECNHMKNQYPLDSLLEKIDRIEDNWNDRILPELPAQIYSIVQIAEKMTKEELQKEREARKQRAIKKHQDYLQTINKTLSS